MKQIYLTLLLCLICFSATSQTETRHLVIQTKDGTQLAFVLTDDSYECLSFGKNGIVINNDTQLDYQNLAKIYITDKAPSSVIPNSDTISKAYSIDNGIMHITSHPNSTISIYTINGVIIYDNDSSSGIEMIDISGFSSGVYVLKINNTSVTFRKS